MNVSLSLACWPCRRYCTEHRPLVQFVLATLLDMVLFDQSQILYNISRPLLVLAFLEEEVGRQAHDSSWW